jgi:pimeloyl-ACP methyl ester carboxylesterase
MTAVMVIGNSIGGWIAAEVALRDIHGRVASMVLLNAVGIRPDNRTQLGRHTRTPADRPGREPYMTSSGPSRLNRSPLLPGSLSHCGSCPGSVPAPTGRHPAPA